MCSILHRRLPHHQAFTLELSPAAVMHDATMNNIDWNSFRIAVVDDNSINQKIIVKLLKKHLDIHIQPEDIFHNGHHCLHALAQKEYDLILLDIEMPVLDGMETAVRIRNGLPTPPLETEYLGDSMNDFSASGAPTLTVLPLNRNVPIVAVTCSALDHQREHYLSLGMNEVVAKPLQPPLLVDAVKRHLRTAQARRDGARVTRHSLDASWDSDDSTALCPSSSSASSRGRSASCEPRTTSSSTSTSPPVRDSPAQRIRKIFETSIHAQSDSDTSYSSPTN
ncbi:hypothetical protein HDU85_002068 [Gaertneriomyces sp. JEL0708]|nr:hypothetical protein HDU85_002068 [Gaertneriomyces sp. JEL0708]